MRYGEDVSNDRPLTDDQKQDFVARMRTAWSKLPSDQKAALQPSLDEAHRQFGDFVQKGTAPELERDSCLYFLVVYNYNRSSQARKLRHAESGGVRRSNRRTIPHSWGDHFDGDEFEAGSAWTEVSLVAESAGLLGDGAESWSVELRPRIFCRSISLRPSSIK
jgi:hypothetical protein